MSLYLGNTKIPAVTVGVGTVAEDLSAELNTQDQLITEIMTALDGKTTVAPTSGIEAGNLYQSGTFGLPVSSNKSLNVNTRTNLGSLGVSHMDSGEYILIVQVEEHANYGDHVVFVVDDMSKSITYTNSMGKTLTFEFQWNDGTNSYHLYGTSDMYTILQAVRSLEVGKTTI